MGNQLSVSRFVNAPPEEVFAAASDLERAPERIEAIVRMEILTPGPVGLGTRFKETRLMFKREASETMEITAWDPPRSYATDAESHGCHYHSVIECLPKDGGTELRMTFEASPLTTVAKVMGFVMKPLMKGMANMVAADLEGIKAAVEARQEQQA